MFLNFVVGNVFDGEVFFGEYLFGRSKRVGFVEEVDVRVFLRIFYKDINGEIFCKVDKVMYYDFNFIFFKNSRY